MANLVLKISSSDSKQNVSDALHGQSKRLDGFLAKIGQLAQPHCSVQLLNGNDVQASATVTMAFANQTDGDTIQIGAMTLTAKTSGASGPQFNIGASDAASAVNLAAAINANSSSLLTASSAAAVVTVKAAQSGTMGNAIPIILTQTSAGMVAAAALSGGAADTAVAASFRTF